MSAPNINAQLKNLSNSGRLTLTNTNNSGRLTMSKAGGGGGGTTYTIGQAALGGIIAYINGGGSTGTSGLVATAADISTGADWGCVGTTIGGTSTALGTGPYNTAAIIAGCSTAGIASRLCVNLTEGGYSDWYLPSKDELNQLYINRIAIGGFTASRYWSSSESNNFFAWDQSFGSGTQDPNGFKGDNTYFVRAIRSF
jgi:hypothetical protein